MSSASTGWLTGKRLFLGGGFAVVLTLGTALSLSGDFIWTKHADPDQQIETKAEPAPERSDVVVPSDVPAHPSSPRDEFVALADRIESGSDPYVGLGALPELKAKLSTAELPPIERINAQGYLSREHLRLGAVDDALGEINLALAEIELHGGLNAGTAELLRQRALVHLREAELQNCVKRHNRECCIFPLQGGAVHTVQEPAIKAKEDLHKYIDLIASAPQNAQQQQRMYTAIWLLNIVYMALNEYPDKVPANVVIPASAFASECDIGRFVDVATQLGVDCFDHAGGVIVDDFDNDGLLDIVTSTCAVRGPMKAFRNTGQGKFEDVGAAWRLDEQLGGLNIISVDYNNDGWLDIFVPRGGWMFKTGEMRKSLLRNESGGGFTDVSYAAGLATPLAPTQTAVWADFDNDGWLDVYIGHESQVETQKEPTSYPCTMYRNNGDGTFSDVTAKAGVPNHRYTKGVAAGDYDNDGDVDIYVSNLGTNRLYRNDGSMRFTDVALLAGVEEPKARSFATWFFDYDNDGWLDIWVGGYGGSTADLAAQALGQPDRAVRPCLYRNNRDGTFTNVAEQLGLSHAYLPMGANFGDFDNDGWLDMYLGTGYPNYDALMPNIALRNDRGQRFQDITQSSGLGHLQKGHGIAFADLDNDGDQDIYHQLGGFFPGDAFFNALYMNPGHENHFIMIDTAGVQTNRMGYGARIKVVLDTPSGERELHRAVGCVSSFGGSPRRQEIGLGDATAIKSIEMWWPKSGVRQTFADVAMDQFIRITEGEDEFETLQPERFELGRTP